MPNPRPHNITIQLPPPIRGIVVAPGETGVGGCTPSVTGLGWCHFLAASRAYLSGTNAAETEFQLLVPDEVPTCSSADIEFMLQDGVVDIAKIGLYEFRLIGETCSCIQEWIVTFKDVQLHPSNFHHFLMQPNGNTLSVYVAVDGFGSSAIAPHILGVWSISAKCNGQTYGPILMRLTGTGPP